MNRLDLSAALHRMVRDFARRSVSEDGFAVGVRDAQFEALACELCSNQLGRPVASLPEVLALAVPTDCFRLGARFNFDVADASLRFVTSGTTSVNSGVHYMRERATYEELSLLWGGVGIGFVEGEHAPIVVALAPWTGFGTSSSLGYMMQRMMERFDGRSLSTERTADGFVLDAPQRWLVGPSGVDLPGLRAVRDLAWRVGTRVTLLATSFALVELLDAAGTEPLELPPGSVVMPTGGFKGRSRTIEPEVMFDALRRMFGDVDIVGEYGMTELTSQLYEGTARRGSLRGAPGVYFAPPWLRVTALEPTTLQPVVPGQVGLACFVDLGNVDSSVCVLTQDLIRAEGEGFRLLGRQVKAPLRGCSLAIEALLRPTLEFSYPSLDAAREASVSTWGIEAPFGGPNDVSTAVSSGAVLRVWKVIEAARSLQQDLLALADSDSDMLDLARTAGLSVEGVRLALTRSLETRPSDADVAELVAVTQHSYGPVGGAVWVLLSSNVFTAPLRAIALGLALSARVKVRPSRREPHFARWLRVRAPGLFEIVEELGPETGDAVLAFGSDEALEAIAGTLPGDVAFHGHGHGMGIAMIGAGAANADAAAGLALDLVLFDQQGCLSPRLVLVDESNDVDAFIAELGAELLAWEQRAPSGNLVLSELHERVWSKRVAACLGRVTEIGSSWIARFDVDSASISDSVSPSIPVPPAARSLSLVVCRDPVGFLPVLAPLVTSVGVAGAAVLFRAAEDCLPKARVVELGQMQTPRLDGPVDRRRLRA